VASFSWLRIFHLPSPGLLLFFLRILDETPLTGRHFSLDGGRGSREPENTAVSACDRTLRRVDGVFWIHDVFSPVRKTTTTTTCNCCFPICALERNTPPLTPPPVFLLCYFFVPPTAISNPQPPSLASAKAASLIFKSPVALASFLGRLASCSALAEFLLNPIFGKLSDTYGRKTILPLGHLSLLVCRFLMFLRPEAMWPLITEQIVTVPFITSFFTTWRASLSDELEGTEFAQAAAKVGVAAGVGLVSGPLVAKFLMNRYDTKWCYLASCGMAATALHQILTQFQETLPVSQRKPLVLRDMQPLSFLTVMHTSPTLWKLMCTTGLQTMTEG
jgi:MFS family permease